MTRRSRVARRADERAMRRYLAVLRGALRVGLYFEAARLRDRLEARVS